MFCFVLSFPLIHLSFKKTKTVEAYFCLRYNAQWERLFHIVVLMKMNKECLWLFLMKPELLLMERGPFWGFSALMGDFRTLSTHVKHSHKLNHIIVANSDVLDSGSITILLPMVNFFLLLGCTICLFFLSKTSILKFHLNF